MRPHPPTLSALAVAVALAAGFPPLGAEEPKREATVDDWNARFEALRRHLDRGEWSEARVVASDLSDEMAARLAGGEDNAKRVAAVIAHRAIAEAELGHADDAGWSWIVAQNLDPALRDAPLDGIGRAGELLTGHRLRGLGEPPPGTSALAAVDPASPAAPVPVDSPPAVPRSAAAAAAPPLEIEIVIDRSGAVRAPVVVDPEGRSPPGRIVLGLEALRRWRFLPAPADAPEAVAMRIDPFRPPPSLPYDVAGHPELQPVHELALRGEWAEAAARVPASPSDAPGGCLDRPGAPSECPRGLAALLRALAAAGRGEGGEAAWHWHVALRFDPALSAAPLSIYGPVGRRLAEGAAACTFSAEPGCPPTPLWRSEPGVTPPRKLEGEAPRLPRELAERGGDRVVLRTVLDVDGRPRDAVALTGRSEAARALALEALAGWRFEPARRGGEPIPVIVELTMPFAIDAPRERTDRWRRRLDDLDRRLRAGEWHRAAHLAERLIDDVSDEADAGGSDLLAEAVAGLALAEAGLGRAADAVWSWHAAQNLARELAWRDLSAYGAAGRLLAAQPLRWPGELAVRTVPPGEGAFDSARPRGGRGGDVRYVQGPIPDYPRPLRLAVPLVEAVVRHGRAESPVVLSSHPPAVVLAALDALRTSTFAPAIDRPRAVLITLPDPRAGGPADSDLADLVHRALAAGEFHTAACLWALVPASERDRLGLVLDRPEPDATWRRDGWWLDAPGTAPAAEPWGRESYRAIPLSKDVRAPIKVHAPPPQYTDLAREERTQGVVVLRTVVDRQGGVRRVEVLERLPHGLTRRAAEAVCQWKFRPATLDGEPVDVYYHLTINFTLQ